jgi:bifunctional non-homologous end joining protein LigD
MGKGYRDRSASAMRRVAGQAGPELVADVEYGSWTADGRLRHPTFKGLRDDVLPSAAEREAPGSAQD